MKRGHVLVLVFLLCISFASAKVSIKDIYSGGDLDEQREESITRYIYGLNGLVASVSNSEINYYHSDRLKSNRVVSDEDGQLVSKFKSLPFGQEIENTGIKFSFATEKELDDSGLYYFGARYYDSDLGRFTSVDPVKENHAYSYVMNNPMNLVDPTGMAGTTIIPDDSTFIGPLEEDKMYASDYLFSWYSGLSSGEQNTLLNAGAGSLVTDELTGNSITGYSKGGHKGLKISINNYFTLLFKINKEVPNNKISFSDIIITEVSRHQTGSDIHSNIKSDGSTIAFQPDVASNQQLYLTKKPGSNTRSEFQTLKTGKDLTNVLDVDSLTAKHKYTNKMDYAQIHGIGCSIGCYMTSNARVISNYISNSNTKYNNVIRAAGFVNALPLFIKNIQ
ncbi:RHS repeat-associated core domain-containing protein [archaeon]|jgi:RHS repeat-associated protein|nr:RHS repeat-associated core domain-containing protein [archaeon]